jgi:type I restriction enzyme S subunit
MEKLYPKLRFPEFNDTWKKAKIGDILKIGSGKDYKHLDTGLIPVFGSGGLMAKVNKPLFSGETIFIGRKGSIDKPFYYEGEFWTVDTLFYTYAFRNSNPKFIFCLFQKINWYLYNEASGVPSLSKKTIESIEVNLTSLIEQQKISSFISKVDEKIQYLKKQQTLLERYKKGLIQKIFSHELRFRDSNNSEYPKWKERDLHEVLSEHGLKSSGNEEVFSVSVHKGLINQIEHLGRSFSAKDTSNYNRVLTGDIVYTKSPTGDFPFGIIKQSRIDKSVIVSPLYGVFTPETFHLGYILNVYFESAINTHNYLSPIIQKGAKNTINITNKNFLSRSLLLPESHEEQKKIADFLLAIDTKIEKVKTQIRLTEEWKKGLLQQMFV